MMKLYDSIHHYKGYHGSRAHCWLRVFAHPDRPTVVVATEMRSNKGTSITNVVETLAADVCGRLDIAPVTLLWVEHYHAGGGLPERFASVEFKADPHGRPEGLGVPSWSPIARPRVEALIGERFPHDDDE